MKTLALVLATFALAFVPVAAHADGHAEPGPAPTCVSVKTVSIVKGKKVTTITQSCPAVPTPTTPPRGGDFPWS